MVAAVDVDMMINTNAMMIVSADAKKRKKDVLADAVAMKTVTVDAKREKNVHVIMKKDALVDVVAMTTATVDVKKEKNVHVRRNNMKRFNNGDFRIENVGDDVELYGWVQKKRNLGGLIFIDLRDRSGIIQLVSRPEDDFYEEASSIRSLFWYA